MEGTGRRSLILLGQRGLKLIHRLRLCSSIIMKSALVGRAWIQAGRRKDALELWNRIWRHRQVLSPDFLKANPRTRKFLEILGVNLLESLQMDGNDPEGYELVKRQLASLQQQG